MHRRAFLSASVAAALACSVPASLRAQARPAAIFINPGRHDEAFWSEVSRAASIAAESLGIDLTVIYGERNRTKTIEVGKQAIAAAAPGTYALIVNEQQTGPDLLEAAMKRGLKAMMVFNPLTGNDVANFGRPRAIHPNFIGQLIPDNVDAGAKIAQAVVAAARGGQAGNKVALLGLNGLSATPAAADREKGLRDFAAKDPNVSLLQVVPTDWTEVDGYNRLTALLQRYPTVNAIWCANDPIAAGAMRALTEAKLQPGKDVAVAGLNWSADGVRAVSEGRMAATVGGHVLCAAFALVLIADHARGVDFAPLGTEMALPFGIIDQPAAKNWLARFGDGQANWKALDFRRLARSYNSDVKTYDFSPPALLA